MSYGKTGLVEAPSASWIPKLTSVVISAGGGPGAWESAVSAALLGGNNFPFNKFVLGTNFNELLALSGKAPFTPSASAGPWTALITLLTHYLHHGGYLKENPVIYEYRQNPELDLEAVVDRILSMSVEHDEFATIGGDRTRWSSLVPLFIDWMRDMNSISRHRSHVASQLRLMARHIGWNIYRGLQPKTAHELTLFLHLAPGSKRAALANEQNGPPSMTCAETSDSSVFATFDLYTKVVLAGPYSRFVTLGIRQLDKSRLFWLGPNLSTLTVSFGIQKRYGPFIEIDAAPVTQIPADTESQLEALSERLIDVFVGPDDNLFRVDPPVRGGAPAATEDWNSLDDPSFRFSYQDPLGSGSSPELSAFDVSYACRIDGRTHLTTNNSFLGAGIMIIDHVMRDEGFTGDASGIHSLPSGQLINSIYSTDISFGQVDPKLPSAAPGWYAYEFIYLADPANHRILRMLVDMTPFMYSYGQLLLLPGMRQHILVPRSWIFTPNPEAVSFIAGQLSLTPGARAVNEQPITMSHNYAKLALLLPLASLPRITPPQLIAPHVL